MTDLELEEHMNSILAKHGRPPLPGTAERAAKEVGVCAAIGEVAYAWGRSSTSDPWVFLDRVILPAS